MSRAISRNGSSRRSRAAFGDDVVAESRRWPARAPLDLRVNTLKATRDEAAGRRSRISAPAQTPHSPLGLRIPPGEDGRGPSLQAEPDFLKGWFEIQDEGSQLAALLAGAQPGEQVLDLCAGAAARRWRSPR